MYLIVTPTSVERFDVGSEEFIARVCALKLASRADACDMADSLTQSDWVDVGRLRQESTGDVYYVVYIDEDY